MDYKLPVVMVAASAVLSLAASAANATVFIGLQQDAGPIVTVQSNSGGFAFFSGSFGEFESVRVVGFGQPAVLPPILLQGGSVVSNSAGNADAGTLKIYITSTAIHLHLVPRSLRQALQQSI